MSTELIIVHPDNPEKQLMSKPFAEMTPEEHKQALLLWKSEIHHQKRKEKENPNRMAGKAEWHGEWHHGRAFLSCIMAGRKIPKEITADCFRMPWNRIIFEALLSMQNIDAGDFQKYDLLVALFSQNPRFDQSFRKYLDEIFNLIGPVGRVEYYAQKLLMLKAGLDV